MPVRGPRLVWHAPWERLETLEATTRVDVAPCATLFDDFIRVSGGSSFAMATLSREPKRSICNRLPIERRQIEAVLAQHGYRLTTPRAVVVDAILRHERPFTAEQLVAELAGKQASIGRATVYRTLEILAAVDVLTRLIQADGRPAYLLGAPGHRHHLVCSECGTAVPFTLCPVDQLVTELTRDTDFAIHDHLLEVFGVCPTCQRNPVASTLRAV